MNAVGMSNIGLVRQNNEDSFLVNVEKGLFAVCDGMGGHKGGEVASSLAIQCIENSADFNTIDEARVALTSAVEKANAVIYKQGRENPDLHEMGTTVTAAAIIDNQMVVVHVGDSSLYLIHDDSVSKITRDHTLAERMVVEGLLQREEIRRNAYNHILTRAVGTSENIVIDVFVSDINQGDRILLCTDGLTDLVEDQDIKEFLADQHDLAQAAQNLINLALSRGGHDNITTVLVTV
ncbi:MAG: Stp1/IreP family PP2C-type Ser/Thr phosphatase [Syntrophomonadaceae bacterium]|jgi:serine/threonine protein phosphatase PrpC